MQPEGQVKGDPGVLSFEALTKQVTKGICIGFLVKDHKVG